MYSEGNLVVGRAIYVEKLWLLTGTDQVKS